jgi:hypothetical protein
METTEDSPIRKTMERRYGKRNLERFVAKCKEARANREWLEQSTMACPRCEVHVEKSMGCNHVSVASWVGRTWCELTGGPDDLLPVQATFLLPLWVEGPGEQPV